MEVSSESVGARCKTLEVVVTPRQAMNYAAGVGDANPWYLDDERPEGIVAPPMLSVALTWDISARFQEYWAALRFPLEALAQQVHYSEYIEWKRPIKPGDQLRIEGEVKAILPHPRGTHLVMAYDAVDPHGEIVFTEHIGGLLRGVSCSDQGRGAQHVPQPVTCSMPETPLWEKTLHIDPLASYVYDACANINFPIHSSPAFAHSVGLPGILYQGTATLALAVREIVDTEAGADPRRLRSVSCNFTGMVSPGSPIRVRALRRDLDKGLVRVYFAVLNAGGKEAIRNGYATLFG